MGLPAVEGWYFGVARVNKGKGGGVSRLWFGVVVMMFLVV